MALLVPSAAYAQGIGFQGGMTVNPEQIYVGTHMELPLGSDQLVLRPAIDGGFGNDLRVAAIGAEIQYRFDLGNSGWRLSQGFGPSVVHRQVRERVSERRNGRERCLDLRLRHGP